MKGFPLLQVFGIFLLCGSVSVSVVGHGTGKHVMFGHDHDHGHGHGHLDHSAWSNSLTRKILTEEDEFGISMRLKKQPSKFLKEVSLHDVRLDPNSIHGQAQQTNLEYLLMLDVDNLAYCFRQTAGLPTPGHPYGGWESPDIEIRGHFVGHYLSATALMWASTHNETIKEKMSALVSALSACQKQINTGYLSAFPAEFFDRLENRTTVWVPYYTIHKIMAGLLDQYIFADNVEALNMTQWMAEYFYNRVHNVIKKDTVKRHWDILNNVEFGGMNDVLYKLFTITKDPKHLLLAHLFDKPSFLGLLAVQADQLGDLHANTHIPIVIGAQMRYEVTGDPLYKTMGTYFMDILNSSHTYATGGTSVKEHWYAPKRLADTLYENETAVQTQTEESCATYNMLKVSRNLFRWTKEAKYADYYERALTNGVLGIQRGREPGVMIYMMPLGHGVSKSISSWGWGTPYNALWCCYGTGVESFSKLGDSIYFEEQGKVPSLYVLQYISSELVWKSGKIVIKQQVDPVASWDPFFRVTLTSSPIQKSKKQCSSNSLNLRTSLNLRIPIWTDSNGATATLNSKKLDIPAPGNFLRVNWNAGDELALQLPISVRTEAIKDDRPEYASLQAILYGHYLLSGYSNGDFAIKSSSSGSTPDWITPVPAAHHNHLLTLSQESGGSTYVMSNSNQSIRMVEFPKEGTDGAVHATFRLVFDNDTQAISNISEAIGKTVMLEPFDLPGMTLVLEGKGYKLGVTDSPSDDDDKTGRFVLVAGLDGKDGSVSLQSESHKDCYVYSGVNYSSSLRMRLKCKSSDEANEFNQAVSFGMKSGMAEYHPISFVAKGVRRNFLLAPIQSFRDEFYNVYFNFEA